MKLNPDCVRNILLKIESLPGVKYEYRFSEDTVPNDFPGYSYEEIEYHLRQCDLHGYLYKVSYTLTGDCVVQDLSPLGHEFLSNIRSDNVWTKTKNVAGKIGSYSLDTLTKIATGVITELIKQQF
ncbi:DUF2513 domain-containing protein [Anaerocolumna sp. MB42-C2]|uniref:DUF2513 domain-containing protein n=1 Tax=Anaerocolumna sp. MB42-C2 TaxID=3070997 RepID=UPI0027DEBE54|nr:DUF2513 domain-containing protein [Anaerocolumna sp. MB42-C2]WMJ85462.1 DUF2513 domain-containing protein [Anaerocolumna sp. MB42-C2]